MKRIARLFGRPGHQCEDFLPVNRDTVDRREKEKTVGSCLSFFRSCVHVWVIFLCPKDRVTKRYGYACGHVLKF